MSKHMPGPWRVSSKHVTGAIVVRGVDPISEIAVVLQNDKRYLAEDHARLIAAAPDLLAELEMLSNVVEGCGMAAMPEVKCRLVFARAAISKATGK